MTLFPGIEKIQPGPSSAAYHRTLSPHKEISTPFDIKKKEKKMYLPSPSWAVWLASLTSLSQLVVLLAVPRFSVTWTP